MRPASWIAFAFLAACGSPGLLNATPVVDLGSTVCPSTASLELFNNGGSPLVLDGVEQVSGTPVRALPFADEADAVFTIDLPADLTLAPGRRRLLQVTYAPDRAGRETQHHARVAFLSGAQRVEVVLQGTLVTVDFDVPSHDFCGVALGDSVRWPLPSLGAGTGWTIEPVGSPFTLEGDALVFSPTTPGNAALVLRGYQPATCLAAPPLLVRGTAVGAVLGAPGAVDFGCVPPGLSATRGLRFSNLSCAPVVLSQLGAFEGVTSSPRFATDAGLGFVVPSAIRELDGGLSPGVATLEVSFTPAALGPVAGQLSATSGLAVQPRLSVPLRAVGGGPDIDLGPDPAVDFGVVSTTQTRRLTLRNMSSGSSPSRCNLHLGLAGQLPAFALESRSGATGNVSVTLASTYDPQLGLGGGESVELEVTVTPSAASEHFLHVFSDDLDEPVTTVTLITR